MGRIFAVGDIHGCFDKLVALMGIIDIDFQNDILLFVGDYVDRGPSSREVVDYLIELGRREERVVFLKGNHEYLFQGHLEGKESYIFLANGGDATLESYAKGAPGGGGFPVPLHHLRFFENLSLYYETEDHIFVHGGLKPGLPLEKQGEKDMLWIRDEFIHSDHDFGKRVVFGHTPFREPLVLENKIGIDTGAVYGNKLTCVELPALRFFSV